MAQVDEVGKKAIKRYFISNFCADTMHLKCGISLKRKRNESSHNATGVSTERMGLGKRVETVPLSHSLTKRFQLESSPAHRHFAISYARNVASKRAILWIIVGRLSAVSRRLKCEVKARVVLFFAAVKFRERATLIGGTLFNGYRGLFPQRSSDRSVKLNTNFHLLQR